MMQIGTYVEFMKCQASRQIRRSQANVRTYFIREALPQWAF